MRRTVLSTFAVLIGLEVSGRGPRAAAVEVTSADGIVVVDITRAEAREVWEAVDAGAAFADLVSPVIPGEYGAAVRLAVAGWQTFRTVFREPIPVRVVLTAVPPAVWILPGNFATANEVVRRYTRFQDRADAAARAVVAPLDRVDAARRELVAAVADRVARRLRP